MHHDNLRESIQNHQILKINLVEILNDFEVINTLDSDWYIIRNHVFKVKLEERDKS